MEVANQALGRLLQVTDRETKRQRRPSGWTAWWYAEGRAELEVVATAALACCGGTYIGKIAGVRYYAGNDKFPWGNASATTVGGKVFVRSRSVMESDPLTAHECIHVLQGEVRGATLGVGYLWEQLFNGTGPSNRYESIGYLWEGHIRMFGNDRLGSTYGDNQPWCYYRPLDSSWNYCP